VLPVCGLLFEEPPIEQFERVVADLAISMSSCEIVRDRANELAELKAHVVDGVIDARCASASFLMARTRSIISTVRAIPSDSVAMFEAQPFRSLPISERDEGGSEGDERKCCPIA
jgi:hypothetical protein